MKSAFALIKVALMFIAGIFARKSGKDAERLKQAKEYQSTRKRMDDAKGSSGNTSDDVDWLSDYGSK